MGKRKQRTIIPDDVYQTALDRLAAGVLPESVDTDIGLAPDDEIAAVNAYINGESVKSLAQRLPLSEPGVYRLIQRVRRRLEDEARQA